MERRHLKTAIGVAMVLVGLAQAWSGPNTGDQILAALGGVYALIGVAYLWADGYRAAGSRPTAATTVVRAMTDDLEPLDPREAIDRCLDERRGERSERT
jgi:hypothetical protein